MNFEIVYLQEKILVGISAITSNDDPNMSKIISTLWKNLYQDGINEKIKNKINEYAIGLYSDYNDNKYLVTTGSEVSKAENEDLSIKKIPKGRYAKFYIEGNMEKAVVDAWNKIWEMDLERSFKADFEEYLNNDFDNAKINIYVSLK